MQETWVVGFSSKAAKQFEKLPVALKDVVVALVAELQTKGPVLPMWKNFSKFKGLKDCYHCHLKAGHPTYVACWEIVDKKIKILEVYYVGTHEKAPY